MDLLTALVSGRGEPVHHPDNYLVLEVGKQWLYGPYLIKVTRCHVGCNAAEKTKASAAECSRSSTLTTWR